MAEFNEDELDKLAYLCRIECTKEEKAALCKHLSNMLAYIKQLEEVDTEGVAPCFTVLHTLTNVMREDEVGGLLARDLFLANAPSHVGGMIRTPPILKHLTS
jgi:aspartyl-tRNA(Asn)/glutamyl-tRNA(Gln) amidotransferase subunit C